MKVKVKYPQVKVRLVGEDGNAFAILGRVRSALRRGGAPESDLQAFVEEATSGDYAHLLATCLKWVSVS